MKTRKYTALYRGKTIEPVLATSVDDAQKQALVQYQAISPRQRVYLKQISITEQPTTEQ
jgi:hypothetical protein